MRSSQLRKTVNRNRNRIRNKRKTWRNKRTKNARGGRREEYTNDGKKYVFEYSDDDDTKLLKIFQVINDKELPTFEGVIDAKTGHGHGNLYRYASDGKKISIYKGGIQGKNKNGRGIYETYDSNGKEDSVYDGEWKDDKKNGRGYYHVKERYTYDGEWKDDKKNGNGIENGNNGEDTIRTEGVWENGTVVSGTRTIHYNDKTKSVYVGGLNGVMVRQGNGRYKVYDADNKLLQDIYAEWDKNEVKTPLLRQPELTPQPSELPQSTPTQYTSVVVPLLRPPPKPTAKTRPPLVFDTTNNE